MCVLSKFYGCQLIALLLCHTNEWHTLWLVVMLCDMLWKWISVSPWIVSLAEVLQAGRHIWIYIHPHMGIELVDMVKGGNIINLLPGGWLFFWEIIHSQVLNISFWGLAVARSALVRIILGHRNHTWPLCPPPWLLHIWIYQARRKMFGKESLTSIWSLLVSLLLFKASSEVHLLWWSFRVNTIIFVIDAYAQKIVPLPLVRYRYLSPILQILFFSKPWQVIQPIS